MSKQSPRVIVQLGRLVADHCGSAAVTFVLAGGFLVSTVTSVAVCYWL
jgi:hypothetical protein